MTSIAVLGAGHGGCACAVDLVLKGFEVSLFSAYNPSHIRPLIEKGGLEYSGKIAEGFAKVNATTNLGTAVKDANVILIITPSAIHEKYARLLAPILKKKNLAHEQGTGEIDHDRYAHGFTQWQRHV